MSIKVHMKRIARMHERLHAGEQIAAEAEAADKTSTVEYDKVRFKNVKSQECTWHIIIKSYMKCGGNLELALRTRN